MMNSQERFRKIRSELEQHREDPEPSWLDLIDEWDGVDDRSLIQFKDPGPHLEEAEPGEGFGGWISFTALTALAASYALGLFLATQHILRPDIGGLTSVSTEFAQTGSFLDPSWKQLQNEVSASDSHAINLLPQIKWENMPGRPDVQVSHEFALKTEKRGRLEQFILKNDSAVAVPEPSPFVLLSIGGLVWFLIHQAKPLRREGKAR